MRTKQFNYVDFTLSTIALHIYDTNTTNSVCNKLAYITCMEQEVKLR